MHVHTNTHVFDHACLNVCMCACVCVDVYILVYILQLCECLICLLVVYAFVSFLFVVYFNCMMPTILRGKRI